MARRLLAAVLGWVLAGVVVVAVVRPTERCPEVTAADARHAVEAAVGWFEANQGPDGRWRYLYDRETGRDVPGYNIVRHAGVLLALYQADRAGVAGARAVAERGLGYAVAHLERRDDVAAFTLVPRVQIGASALLATALVERRLATGVDDLDPTLRRIGHLLRGQVTPSGAVDADWDSLTGQPVAGTRSRYYTGQTMWVLARLHRLFPDEGWDEPARRVSRYLSTERDQAEPRFPPIADHWAAYGLDEQAHWPDGPGLTDDDLAYARHLAGAFASQTRFESQRRETGPARVLRLSIGSASGVGTLGEGLGALWRLSQVDSRFAGSAEQIAEPLRCVAGLLVDRQVDSAPDDPHPERVVGAWFQNGRTRMDDQQHALSALLASAPTLVAEAA